MKNTSNENRFNLKKGQKIFYTEVHTLKHGLVETTIQSVGSKYFTLSGLDARKFFLKTLKEASNYQSNFYIYFSKQEYDDTIERSKLLVKIKNYCDLESYKLEALREINAILDNPKNKI